ncbi:MAG: hypothetical protein L3J42_03190 [Hydrogenimonas sp.]|nr:hypothetical protein [Hydrogenimonas sp.]
MKLYYYIDTGHRVGLDRLRRSAPVVKALQNRGVDVTLLTNDFRAGEYAKNEFAIKRYISVDLVRNIANIATPADSVVIDSDDVSLPLVADMIEYYGGLVRFSDDPQAAPIGKDIVISSISQHDDVVKVDIVDPSYFERRKKSLNRVYFWGDDDYECGLVEHLDAFKDLGVKLLEGYYFFMQYGDELEKGFDEILESENYKDVLKSSEEFLTSSPQSALEALAAGSNPIYIKKESSPRFWSEKLLSFGIPVIESFDKIGIENTLALKRDYNRGSLSKDSGDEVAEKVVDFWAKKLD